MCPVFISRASQPQQPVSHEKSHPSTTERDVDVVFRDVTPAGHDPEAAEALRVFASEYAELASQLFESDCDLTSSIEPHGPDHI